MLVIVAKNKLIMNIKILKLITFIILNNKNIINKIVMITLYNIIMDINMIIFNKINNIKINIKP